MSWDQQDFDLLAAFKTRFGLNEPSKPALEETRVLDGARHVYNNAIDVAVDMQGTKAAAASIWKGMQAKEYSTKTWSMHELHPKAKDETTVDFIFTMDLLNFSFWSERDEDSRFAIDFRSRRWTGYWSLVAALQRALEEGIPITSPDFWQDANECTNEVLRHVFRSATEEEIPLFEERAACLREAGKILYENFGCKPANIIKKAEQSAAVLVNLLAKHFPVFRDEVKYEDERVRFLKRAQILVADLWACFEGQSFGSFNDIDKLTAFADYRIPQMLYSLGCISYSPPLDGHIRRKAVLETGHDWEIQIRGCSIYVIELIRKEILAHDSKASVNPILIDFFLYDMSKERESSRAAELIPHHRTRSIWY